jgi:hypothetical protein
VVRDVVSTRRMCLNGAQAVVAAAGHTHAVAITDPPLLRWHESTHHGFLQTFRREVQQLLLCWRRLGAACSRGSSNGGGSSSSSGGSSEPEAPAASLGSLPFELVSWRPAAVGRFARHKCTMHKKTQCLN